MSRSEYVDYKGIKRAVDLAADRWGLAISGSVSPKHVEDVRKQVIRLVVRFSEGAAACAQEQAIFAGFRGGVADGEAPALPEAMTTGEAAALGVILEGA